MENLNANFVNCLEYLLLLFLINTNTLEGLSCATVGTDNG